MSANERPPGSHVHDKHPLPDLLHGQEGRVYGDCAYAWQQELIHSKAPEAADWTNQRVRKGSVTEALERMVNRVKSWVRARVEHVFAVVKRLWRLTRCATAAWPRTPRARSSRSGWPTSTLHEGHWVHRCAHEARSGPKACCATRNGSMRERMRLKPGRYIPERH